MPSTKRPAELAPVASHAEVYRLVRRHKIHNATELYELAQEQSTGGDDRLLHYCSGDAGMKKNLQSTVDNMWMPDGAAASAAVASGDSVCADATHRAALCNARLKILQQRALAPPPTLSLSAALGLGSRTTTSRASGRGSSVRAIRDALALLVGDQCQPPVGQRSTAGPQEEVQLFDHFGAQLEVVFRPRGGIWRLRDLYEVLVECQSDPRLSGAAPSPAPEGGIRFPRTEAGWRAMLKAGTASPRIPFGELSPAEKAAAASEARLGLGCGALLWQQPPESPGGDSDAFAAERSSGAGNEVRLGATVVADHQGRWVTDTAWIFGMPKAPDFEKDTFADIAAEERLVRFWARGYVEHGQWLALLQAIEVCQHKVHLTKGFQLKNGSMSITGSKARQSVHKHGAASRTQFGALAAQACAAEEDASQALQVQGKGKRLFLLGNGRSAQLHPEAPLFARIKLAALADKPGLGRHLALRNGAANDLVESGPGSRAHCETRGIAAASQQPSRHGSGDGG